MTVYALNMISTRIGRVVGNAQGEYDPWDLWAACSYRAKAVPEGGVYGAGGLISEKDAIRYLGAYAASFSPRRGNPLVPAVAREFDSDNLDEMLAWAGAMGVKGKAGRPKKGEERKGRDRAKRMSERPIYERVTVKANRVLEFEGERIYGIGDSSGRSWYAFHYVHPIPRKVPGWRVEQAFPDLEIPRNVSTEVLAHHLQGISGSVEFDRCKEAFIMDKLGVEVDGAYLDSLIARCGDEWRIGLAEAYANADVDQEPYTLPISNIDRETNIVIPGRNTIALLNPDQFLLAYWKLKGLPELDMYSVDLKESEI